MSKVPFRRLAPAALALCALAVASAADAASQRTFVASYGSDASAACSLALPCRAFAAAIAQTFSVQARSLCATRANVSAI